MVFEKIYKMGTKEQPVKPRIAFLCFSALPYQETWGSAQRVHYMANTLSSSFEVTVFAAKCTDIKKNDDIERNYKTIFFEDNLSKRLFGINKLATPTSGKRNCPKKRSIKVVLRNAAISTLKRVNNLLYNEPTYFKGLVSSLWIHKYGNTILQYITESKIRVLIISIPPWNLLSLSFIKQVKALGCIVIIDYRDPWNCWNDHKGIPLKNEKKFASLADAIFVTNQNHAKKLYDDFALESGKIHVVMNGYDAEKWSKVSSSDDSNSELLEFAFIGSIQFGKENTFRDPTKFVKALELFEHKDKVRFRVIGCKDMAVIESMKDRLPNFEMIESVSQTESFHWMMKSDVLINFHTTNDDSSRYLIAGKVFDYYRSGAKILSINGPLSYERFFVEQTGSGYYAPNDVEQILETIRAIYNDWQLNKKSFRRIGKVDGQYSRQFQNEIAKTIIEDLIFNG